MIKVLIVDDMEPICKRYERILNGDPNIDVIGVANTGKEAMEKVNQLQPDVILMDIEMESKTAGLTASKEIIGKYPEIKIVILTVYEEDELVFRAFQLGVVDYFLKNSPPADIITCVKDAYRSLSPIRPIIAQKIRREFQRVKNRENSFLYTLQIITQLTQTELDVLDLLCKGYTRTQICEIRCVELSTIKTQIHNILRKFEMESMSEVVACVNRLGIIDYIRMT